MKKILLFLDLDDTIFQTRRKNKDATIQATYPANIEKASYMSNSQSLMFELFYNNPDVMIIPVTARDIEQYKRTEISKKSLIAVTYFAGMIVHNNEIDLHWQKNIQDNYKKMQLDISTIFTDLQQELDPSIFKSHIVEDFYIVIKNKFNSSFEHNQQNEILKLLLLKKITDEYFIHHNNNNISIIPKFIDKKNAVKYLIEKYQPELTIGMGDSFTDINFMNLCDFKIIPTQSQINKLFETYID